MKLTRKDVLKLGVMGSAVAALPITGRAARSRVRMADRLEESQLPKPFQVPFAVSPPLYPVRTDATTDYYQVTTRAVQREIIPGKRTLIYGYNGITPGPTIRVRRGRRVVVRHINSLPDRHPYLGYECATSLHLHGNATLPAYDGWADDLIHPGYYKDYVYPNDQNERSLWYHDHAIHRTAQNSYMGLAGFYITDEELGLGLPTGRYDVPIVLQDKIFAKNGSLIYDDEGEDDLYGDVILVNGKPWPVMKVERRKYWFRFLNASLSRSYKLALSSGEPLIVGATDGGLMPAPQRTQSLRLGMAERYGILIDFANYKVGDQIVLRNLELDGNDEEFDSTRRIMRFDVVSDATDITNNSLPEVLNPDNETMLLQPSEAVRTRKWELGRKHGLWVINDKTWNPNRSDANPALGSAEIWEFENKSGGWFHPMHIHLVDHKILSREGGKVSRVLPYEIGPKDTAYVGEGETVRVIMRFGPFKGRFMMHCHNIVHEDHDMMTHFTVGDDYRDPASLAPPRPLPAPPL